MSVHHEITKLAKGKSEIVEKYRRLDLLREQRIEEALEICRNGGDFDVNEINEATSLINQFAAIHRLPSRKWVTKQMVIDFAKSV